MNEELKKVFDKWVEQDVPLRISSRNPYNEEMGWIWFNRGYNHSLAEIRRLQDEVKSLEDMG